MLTKKQLEDAAKCTHHKCANCTMESCTPSDCAEALAQTALVYRAMLKRLDNLLTNNIVDYEFKESWQGDAFRQLRKEIAALLKEE